MTDEQIGRIWAAAAGKAPYPPGPNRAMRQRVWANPRFQSPDSPGMLPSIIRQQMSPEDWGTFADESEAYAAVGRAIVAVRAFVAGLPAELREGV